MKKIILTALIASTGLSASTANAQGLFSWLTGGGTSCPPCTQQPVYNTYTPATSNWSTPRPVTPYNTNYAPQQPGYGIPSRAAPYYPASYYGSPAYPQASPVVPRQQVVPVNTQRTSPGLFNLGWSLW
jgi:hypothetical protein